MIETQDIIITKATQSKIDSLDLNNIPFGRYFTDHMLIADYANGEWGNVEIKPYQAISFDPSMAAIHYGQAIFEGVKAYKTLDGKAQIFRPEDNYKRFNIRPFMFATDELIGVKPSATYKFMIILSPTGPYYSAPMRIYVEEKYVRAVEGGVGFAKAAGNYGAALLPTEEAKRKGYDQILWMDAFEHKYVQECGTMNVFFIIGNKAITPALDSGTILAGVTRDSTIRLLEEMGLEVEERKLSIDEIVEAHKTGELKEVFGTGTAVTISMIKELRYKDYVMNFDVENWKVAPAIKNNMDAIKDGSAKDRFNWMTII